MPSFGNLTTAPQIEYTVQRIAQEVEQGRPVEDSRVELKASWINPAEAAARLAGHANAANGELILWIIGLDEKKGVVGVDAEELSTWHAQVLAQFEEGVAPVLVRHVAVRIEDKTVVALCFETDRVPFMVKNSRSEFPKFWTPWRKAADTRPASRRDLLQMLVPLATAPLCEVLSAAVRGRVESRAAIDGGPSRVWTLYADLYLVPMSKEPVVYPRHKRRAMLSSMDGSEPALEAESVDFAPQVRVPGTGDTGTIGELPGFSFATEARLEARFSVKPSGPLRGAPSRVRVQLAPAAPTMRTLLLSFEFDAPRAEGEMQVYALRAFQVSVGDLP
jgi:hypothetical protein